MAISWREWQETCFGTYLRLQSQDFLLTGTPGAGKTKMALRIAEELIKTKVDRLVIVTPTAHLKLQWAEEAERFELPLDVHWGEHRGFEAPPYKGIVLTYAQVGQRGNSALHRALCSRRRTAVIFR
jgi:superfamily II DNA or RNA helicase